MCAQRISYQIFEEICSIRQIFEYHITPDVSNINLEENYEINDVIIDIKYPHEIDTNTAESIQCCLKLGLKLTNRYPHDLPVITVSNVTGLSTENIEVLSRLLYITARSLCGKLMLMELILCIEDFLNKIYNSSSSSQIEKITEEKGIIRTSTIEVSSSDDINYDSYNKKDKNANNYKVSNFHEIGHHFCINEVLNCRSRIDLIQKFNCTPIKYQLKTCEMHHCGICHCYGLQCSEYFCSYYFRVWRFSDWDKFSPEISPQSYHHSLELSIFNLCETFNETKELNHVNLAPKPKSFVYKTISDTYLFIGSPISCITSIPMCSYFDGLLIKVTEKTIHSFIKQILQGLQYLHSNSIVHGSLYPCSILILSDLRIVLRDNGCMPKVWDLWMKNQQINKRMRANINLHHFTKYSSFVKYNLKGDIFFFGLIVLSFCECKIYNKLPIRLPHIFNLKFVDFIRSCVSYVESCRSTAQDLLKHPYITVYQPTDSIWVGMNVDGPDIDLDIKSNDYKSNNSKDVESRLLREFDLLSVLGKGAFGVVVLARNRIDRCIYAVKRIMLNERNMSEKNRILREIKFLSRLNHANIVRYYSSWVEYKDVKWFSDNIEPNSDDESDSLDLVSNSDTSARSELISSQSTSYDPDETIVFGETESSHKFVKHSLSSKESSDSYILTDKRSGGACVFLYMQMEYCEKKTLRDVIDSENLCGVDDRLWRFFRDICEGLSYIHSQGMVHRDIKPENILITSIDHAKIVDFNLAMVSVQRDSSPTTESVPNYSTETMHKYISSYGSSVCAGTFPYTAPEINADSIQYKQKVPITSKIDMYSFGVVFFEMCHPPFYTKSERHTVINKVKNEHCFPKIFDPNKIAILKGLLDQNYLLRLSADDLLLTNLYPIALKDTNFDKVIQYVMNDPVSSHSRKLLNSFFVNDKNIDVVGNFNSKFFNKTPFDLIINSWDRICCANYIKKYFTTLGCIDLQTPTFHRYINRNIYDSLSNLTYVDSKGTRLYLEPYNLLSIFKLVSNTCATDFYNLPILKYGGMNLCHKCDESSTNEHPYQSYECYIGIVCNSNNKVILSLTECIQEMTELLKITRISNLKITRETLRIYENVQDIIDKYGVVESLEININHYQLLVDILQLYAINKDEMTNILTKLSKNQPLDFLQSEESSIKRKRQQLLNLLQFKGSFMEFIEALNNSITVTESLNNSLNLIKELYENLSIYHKSEVNVYITPSLYNCDIWPVDSFVFQIIGIKNQDAKHDDKDGQCVLANGGLYNYTLKHIRFFPDNIKDHIYMTSASNIKKSKHIRIAYCSIPGNRILTIVRLLHLNRTCINTENCSQLALHDLILICYIDEEDDTTQYDISKLHSISSKLRRSASFMPVYTYNSPLTITAIRELREKVLPLNIVAIAAVKSKNLSVRLFFIDKNKNEEILLSNPTQICESVLKYQNRLKTISLPVQATSINSLSNINKNAKEQKMKEISFLFDEVTIQSVAEKKHATNLRYAITPYSSLFSDSAKFIAVIADLNNEDFNEIIKELSLTSNQIESTLAAFLRKTISSNVQRIIKLILDNLAYRSNETIYFLYSPLISKIRPLL